MDEQAELARIVSAARELDADAIACLFDRYYDPVYRYAYARLGNAGDAEDAAADTFVAMVGALPRFRWRGVPFEAWLFRIAMSKVVDVARRRMRVVTADLSDIDAADRDADPARVVDAREDRRTLIAAVDQLPRDQRDVLMLRYFVGRTIRETAEQLGRSEGAIKQLQFRGLATLRRRAGR